jgi:hypothetical protein
LWNTEEEIYAEDSKNRVLRKIFAPNKEEVTGK